MLKILRAITWANNDTDQRHIYVIPAGVEVTKPISSVPLFSQIFSIVKTYVSYWISRLYLAGVIAAQLRGHLSNITVIQMIQEVFFQDKNAYGEINERSFSNPHPRPSGFIHNGSFNEAACLAFLGSFFRLNRQIWYRCTTDRVNQLKIQVLS